MDRQHESKFVTPDGAQSRKATLNLEGNELHTFIDELEQAGVFDLSGKRGRNLELAQIFHETKVLPIVKRGPHLADLCRRWGITAPYFTAVLAGHSATAPFLL